MTCKDCINFDVCLARGDIATKELLDGAEIDCDFFKNKDDFVEVGRCRDCGHYYSYDEFDRNAGEIYVCYECSLFKENLGKDGFCSRWERRDG